MQIIFFGGNRLKEDGPLGKLAAELSKTGDDFVVFTDPLHLMMQTENYPTFEAQLRAENISYQAIDTLDVERIKNSISDTSIGLSVNANWIFPQSLIRAFSGRLFNYHNATLPQERGAACYTWKILMQSKHSVLTLHKVASKIDAGEIVDEQNVVFPESCVRPLDFYQWMTNIEQLFLLEFIKKIKHNEPLLSKHQTDENSFYWPPLATTTNGFVDWRWSAFEIKTFIDAFGEPHEGASTFLGDSRIFLKNCEWIKPKGIEFHPFQAGIIFRKDGQSLFVAANGGYLIINDFAVEPALGAGSDIMIGTRMYTPQKYLEQAMMIRPAFSASGIKLGKFE